MGETAGLALVLYAAHNGLSGFEVVVTIQDPDVAEVVGVEFPDFGLTYTDKLPATALRLRAVDLNEIVSPGWQASVLSTLALQGKARGTTVITLEISAMDDEQGEAMQPFIVSVLLSVD